jgi:hypothetical protein
MTTTAQSFDTSLLDVYPQDGELLISFSNVGREIDRLFKQNQAERRIDADVTYSKALYKLHQTILDFKDDELEMDSESIEIACEFLEKLSRHLALLNAVSISADPEGKTVLRWKAKTKGVFSMSVGTNRVLYYASTVQGEDLHGKEFFDGEIPSAILAILAKI